MPDPLIPSDPGLLASLLDTARLGGFAVRNVFKGNPEGAGRNVVDLLGRTADSLLPGDWIPDVSRPEDRPEFRDVVDVGGDGLGSDVVNFLGDVATDPLSYIPGAWVAKGAGAVGNTAKAGAALLPDAVTKPIAQAAAATGQKVRATFGAQRISPGTAQAVAAKQAASDLVGRAGSEGAVDALSGLTERELRAIGEAGHGLRLDPVTGRPVSVIDESGSMNMDQRLRKLLEEDPSMSPERLLAALPKAQSTLKDMWASGQEAATSPGGGVYFRNEAPATPDVLMGGYKEVPNQGVRDYFPKQFSGLKEDEIDALTGLPKDFGRTPDLAGLPSPIKERIDWKPKDILDYMTRNPNVDLEFNAAKAMARRAATEGDLAGRAQVGQSLFDRAAAGEVNLPDELARMLAAKQNPVQKSVVGASGANMGEDVASMLGGGPRPGPRAASPDIADPYDWPSNGILGNLLDPENSMNKWQAEQNLGEVGMGLGTQSGKSVVGASTARAPEFGVAPAVSQAEHKAAREYLKSNSFRYADPELRSVAHAIIKQFPAEEATVLLNALDGLAPAGAFVKALGKLNTYFKPYAVYGAIVPKLGSITRNLTGGLFQQFANAEARGDIPRAAAQLIPNWLKSVDDGVEKLTGARFSKNEFADVDAAFKAAGGDPRKVLPFIKDKTMREAVEKGVLGNTFVNTEQLIMSAVNGGWKSLGKNLMDYPGAMFKGAEQRMRYGLYKSMRAKGKSADEAAKVVNDSFYDYSISSTENRTARALIPFFQFTAKAIPQQAKLLAEKPIVASAMANLSGGAQGDPLPPYMEGKINIPIGRDELGNKQYISNLGLPVEALGWLPNPSADLGQFGRQVEQSQVGSLNPLLKTAFATVSGEDPYFGTPYGSYSKVGGVDLGKPGAAINQLLGTGLPGASAISGLLGMGSKVTDDRTSAGEKVANLLTGSKITSVDPDVALRQRLQSYLESNPDVQQFRSFFQTNKDEETQALLRSLAEAKKRIKDKAKASAAVN